MIRHDTPSEPSTSNSKLKKLMTGPWGLVIKIVVLGLLPLVLLIFIISKIMTSKGKTLKQEDKAAKGTARQEKRLDNAEYHACMKACRGVSRKHGAKRKCKEACAATKQREIQQQNQQLQTSTNQNQAAAQ